MPRGALPNFLKNFAQLPVTGFSVTIPHKEAAYEEAVNRDESAELIKAANTLILTEGGYSASNTDYTAARDSILNNLPQHGGKPIELNKMAALVLGAGGVARAIVHVLHQFGMQISVTNRTLPRAQEVAKLVQAKAIPWEGRHNVRCDFLVNCTPVGMHPHVDDTPIHHSFLKPGLIVFDTVYTPENTLLVKEARARGCHVITGVDMFVRQATEQFRKFTGIDAYDMLRKEVKRALLPIHIREEDETK
ncbi:MAG: hypothetical protein KatS3mg105_1034 [Gemmatales bacterium]|nr:MAG: hypothetical protein KatS3mg105_1034 [Gemmatales bacterium]